MMNYKFAIGALAMSALLTLVSAASAQHYWGPTRVGDQCFKRGLGSNGSFGYWETCKDASTGTTASAQVARPAAKKKGNSGR
jgi:hypothetical protein